MNRQTLDIPTAARPEGAAATGETAPATTALQSLAERFRTAGLFLVMFRPDGSVAYHDADGGGFFKRYVLPLLQSHDRADAEVRRQLATLTTLSAGSALVTPANATAELTVLTLPGVAGVAFPYAEKRLTPGLMVIVGKGADFTSVDDLPEDVARACGALELDATWLAQQAETLPGYGPEAIKRQGRAFLTAAREQVRMAGLEQELDSLSGQLANTYEELSLIYQISSGMKINRRAPDFFRQACLDVREVMNVGGMGFALNADISNRPDPALYGTMPVPQHDVARLAEELTAMLWERKSTLLITDLSADRTFGWAAAYARQLLAVPLERQDQVLGCLFALDKQDGEVD